MTEPSPEPNEAPATPLPHQSGATTATVPVAPPPGNTRAVEPERRRRRWVSVLRIVVLVMALPVAAFVIGLLISWISHLIRGASTGTRHASPAPPPATVPTRAAATTAPPRVVVPNDWVTETSPPAGLTYRHPAGWIRRTAQPEVLRLAPATGRSTDPGVEGVGAGIEASTDPAQAAVAFATRVYGAQPGFSGTAAVPVTLAGRHPGEQQVVLTYIRSGVEVRVVIHSFRSGDRTVLVLGRAASAQPGRSAQLEALVEASLLVTG